MNKLEDWLKQGLPILEDLTSMLNNIETQKDLTETQKEEIEKLKSEAYQTINSTKPTFEDCISQLHELRKKASL
jgi:hypothetical protein